MLTNTLAIVAYVVATFAVQATSHFAINADHYAAMINLRGQPIFALGFASMLIQGGVFAWLYARLPGAGRSMAHSLTFAWAVGAILVSYISLAEPAKYDVPSISAWMLVELTAGFAQFTLYGVLLAATYRVTRKSRSPLGSLAGQRE